MTSLADALPAKIKEMNEEIIPAYVSITWHPMAQITVNIMRAEVQRAVEALASGDVVAMLEAYADQGLQIMTDTSGPAFPQIAELGDIGYAPAHEAGLVRQRRCWLFWVYPRGHQNGAM